MVHFTEREIEVLRLAKEGKVRKEIAAALHVKEGTVHSHFKTIYIKTKTRNLAQLIVWMFKNELQSVDPGEITNEENATDI